MADTSVPECAHSPVYLALSALGVHAISYPKFVGLWIFISKVDLDLFCLEPDYWAVGLNSIYLVNLYTNNIDCLLALW